MGKAKEKFYVVWIGREPGVYGTWDECKAQAFGFPGARYHAYPTREAAQTAFEAGPPESTLAKTTSHVAEMAPAPKKNGTLPPEVDPNGIAVDAACSGNPGKMEYRGMDLRTGEQLFHLGPIWATNNVGEFLAIVHALAWLTQRGEKRTIYSDSRNALLWIKARNCRTKLVQNAKTQQAYDLIQRAVAWLQTHKITIPVKKWDTSRWGEIPADFGRK